MIKSVFRFILFILPLGVILIGGNLCADPAGLFDESLAKDFALSLLSGNDTYLTSGNIDQRRSILYRIDYMKKPYDVVAIGPSLIMCLSKEMVQSDSFMNFGESAANYYDIMAVIGKLDERNLLPKKIIIDIDTTMFDKARPLVDRRWYYAQKDYANYILNKIGAEQVAPDYYLSRNIEEQIEKYSIYSQLFRLEYFQTSLNLFKKESSFSFSKIGIAKEDYSEAYWKKDGSRVYPLSVRQATVSEVNIMADEYIKSQFNGLITVFTDIDPEFQKGFELLVEYLANKGVEIEFFLCPFHPLIWKEIQDNPKKWSLQIETEDFIYDFANKNRIHIIGSYNPEKCKVDERDFYDARHMRSESLARIFNQSATEVDKH